MPASPLFLPRCFAEKLGERVSRSPPRDFFSSSCHPHTPKRVLLFMSRQARRSRRPPPFFPTSLSLSLPSSSLLPFSLSACAPPRGCTEGSGKKRTRHRLFDSSPLLTTASLSLRCPGETVIDVRPGINREKERERERGLLFLMHGILSFSLFSPSFLALVRVFLCFPRCSRYGSPQTLD